MVNLSSGAKTSILFYTPHFPLLYIHTYTLSLLLPERAFQHQYSMTISTNLTEIYLNSNEINYVTFLQDQRKLIRVYLTCRHAESDS